jgi:hypothetical protein
MLNLKSQKKKRKNLDVSDNSSEIKDFHCGLVLSSSWLSAQKSQVCGDGLAPSGLK